MYHPALNSDSLLFLHATSLCSERKKSSVTEYPSGVWPGLSVVSVLGAAGSQDA